MYQGNPNSSKYLEINGLAFVHEKYKLDEDQSSVHIAAIGLHDGIVTVSYFSQMTGLL